MTRGTVKTHQHSAGRMSRRGTSWRPRLLVICQRRHCGSIPAPGLALGIKLMTRTWQDHIYNANQARRRYASHVSHGLLRRSIEHLKRLLMLRDGLSSDTREEEIVWTLTQAELAAERQRSGYVQLLWKSSRARFGCRAFPTVDWRHWGNMYCSAYPVTPWRCYSSHQIA